MSGLFLPSSYSQTPQTSCFSIPVRGSPPLLLYSVHVFSSLYVSLSLYQTDFFKAPYISQSTCAAPSHNIVQHARPVAKTHTTRALHRAALLSLLMGSISCDYYVNVNSEEVRHCPKWGTDNKGSHYDS